MPFLFDIKQYSINDGPGVRVTVFFKGCPLSCKWCHNPESQSFEKERLYNRSKCIGCGSCVVVCKANAISLTQNEGIVTNISKCNVCGSCVEVCPTKAMQISGEKYEVNEVMRIILRETNMMDSSGGGVTFSGGEPLMYPHALKELLILCKNEGIHCAVDTSGYVKSSILEDIIPFTDLFLYDIKHIDTHIHKKWTGVGNELILHNLHLIASRNKAYHIRIPLVKGVNTDDANILATTDLLNSLPHPPLVVGLLPYHNIASKKYEKLGKIYNEYEMCEPDKDELAHILTIFKEKGLHAVIGG